MSSERDIFLEALEQPSGPARTAFLEHATGGDFKLRQAVEALLANHQPDTFLEQGAAERLRDSLDAAGKLTIQEERVGDFIGRYKLLEKIGEGGFGVVYRAEQREPVRRQVAIKVIKLGMDTRSIVARFEAERQALALMDHPGIARVLDGGATTAGRPFFVMELVRGVRITDHCQANQLPLHARLALFIQLCHAIQHAHQKGVIHRDLKPSNVLVTVQDGRPVPKVIDFGVAKAIEEPLTEKTILTNFHAFIGTPAYTSPEQAEMTGSDVDTRSDIYSLGVLLYELLTGVTPFDAKELTQSGLDGMRRTIKEVEPPVPSTRLRRAAATGATHAPIMTVDRDLDWIVMKCLEKDRTRRYETALELAADLQRYLTQQPVLARPQNTAYRLRKALRRHRIAFAATAAIFAAVVVGTTVSVWQAVRATSAERVSEQRRRNEEVLRHRAERERENALESQDRAQLNEYVADINLAHQSILAGNLTRATVLLAKHRDLESGRFEWRYMWHAAQGDEHKLLAQETSSILSLATSSEWTVVGLQDSVRVYDAKTGVLVQTLPKPGFSVAMSPKGLLATSSRTAVRVWRMSDWTEVYSLPDHSDPVAFSPDGQQLAAALFNAVCVYRSSDGKLLAEIPGSMPPFAFSPQGDVIAIDSTNGIALWDLGAALTVRTLERSDGIFGAPWLRGIKSLTFSPDGKLVIGARNTLREDSIFVLEAWEVATGKKLATVPQRPNAIEHSGMISAVACAPSGRLLASGSWDHSIRLWDPMTLQCVERLYGNPAEVWAVAFTPDGRGVISGAKDGTVRLWPTNAAPKERLFAGNWTPIKFSKDGQTLATIADPSKLVLLNLKTGEPNDQFPLSRSQWGRWCGAISDDFRFLVDPISESGFRVWDLKTRESVDIENEETQKSWTAISPDSASLLAGAKGDSILWWNLLDLKEAPIRIEGRRALFAQHNNILVTLQDKSVRVSNAKSRSLIVEFPVETELSIITPSALSDDGHILALGSNPFTETDNAIWLWDTRDGKLLGVCKGHTQGVARLAFSADAKTLVSASSDSTLRFWDLRTQQELLSIQRLADPINDFLFSPDGVWLAARTTRGLRLLDGSPERENPRTAGLDPRSGQ